MHRASLKLFATMLSLGLTAYGQQSLGDIARQYREKKETDQTAATPAKVITNQDLGEGPEGMGPQAAPKPARQPRNFDDHTAQQTLAEEREAQHWKGQILTQKRKIASMQAQIDQANANIRSAYGSAAVEGPFTRSMLQAQQHVAQMQLQLDDQKHNLEEMQDAARRAGMHTAVYDP